MKGYIVLVIMWGIYFFLHSFLISVKTKAYFQKVLKDKFKYYRLSYNIFSTITLLPIIIYSATINSSILIPKNGLTTYLGLMIATLGLLVGKRGFKHYDTKEFLGIRQVKNEESKFNEELKRKGILGYIRHPLYLATLLMVIGFWLFSPSLTHLVTTICIIIYLIIGIQLEERKLIREFGDAYREYKKEVPMLIPFLKF